MANKSKKAKKKTTKANEANNEENVGTAVSKTELFFQKYDKLLTWILVGIIVVIFGIYAVNKWVRKPKREEATSQTFVAERYFRQDEFGKALNGDGNNLGFLDIIKHYGAMGGEDVYFYTGICEYNQGNYEEAIMYLKKYKSKEPVTAARALCNIGDSYVNLNDNENALKYYKKAIEKADNPFTAKYMLKAGIICEELGENDEALKYYNDIKIKYPQTYEAYEIDKYISRITK
ncbi:MAG: tetratricopeptide repeat protein [Bacteroidales bacterium]|jgi:tetratricopeptide (TPR) repeat protein|nr:tetratricopeptide repeat protein [Bacteroidales bacterium]MCI2121617.1 tetratricopeptide repeat protein [Bacteroidales bacterium]MCI2144704.1 tetratricopeptide repeat protein [Bacteroidales bacterium]